VEIVQNFKFIKILYVFLVSPLHFRSTTLAIVPFQQDVI